MRIRTDGETPRIEAEARRPKEVVAQPPPKKPEFESAAQKKEYEKRTGRKDAFSVRMKPVGRTVAEAVGSGVSAIATAMTELKAIDPKTIGELDIKKGQAMQAEAKELRAKADSIETKAKGMLADPNAQPMSQKIANAMIQMADNYRGTADKLEAAGKQLEETGKKILETGKLPLFEKLKLGEVWTLKAGFAAAIQDTL